MTDPGLSAIEWDDELSAFDYAMLRADMDYRSRTTIMTIETLDVVPDWERLRNDLDRASRLVPRLRQSVVAPLVPVTRPRWVLDPDFDLDYHLRRVVLPQPADMRALLDFAQHDFAKPLDLGRPLWEMTLCEAPGPGSDAAAIVWKLSHTVTDGIGGLILDQIIRHDERDPDLGPMPPIPAPSDRSPVDMTRDAVRKLPLTLAATTVRRTGAVLGATRVVLRDPAGAAGRAVKTAESLRKMISGRAEPSPLLAGRSTNGRFEMLHFPLDDLRGAAKAHECSVNDAYIAAICGALRLYHEAKGVPIDEVSLGMPINVRPADGADAVANQWSAATIAAPVGIEDPVERMKRVRAIVLSARSELTVNPIALVAPVLSWIPQPLLAALSGGANLGLDVQASNVPGHPKPRYIGGAEITRSIPMGPASGVAMMITMLSLNRKCSVGVHYDTAAVTDPKLFLDSLHKGFDEVFALGQRSADDR